MARQTVASPLISALGNKEEEMNLVTFGALFLLVGGLVHTVPPLATGLAGIFGGTPVIQIVMGAISIVLGLIMLVKKTVLS